MSGAACNIIVKALIRFQKVPTDPFLAAQFDAQVRECISNPIISQAIVNEAYCDLAKLYAILDKAAFTLADREWLLKLVQTYSS